MGLIPAAQIPIHYQSMVVTDGSSSTLFDLNGVIDGTIYRILSSQDDMKSFQEPLSTRTEFDLFIQYAQQYMDGVETTQAFQTINLYLGSLGV